MEILLSCCLWHNLQVLALSPLYVRKRGLKIDHRQLLGHLRRSVTPWRSRSAFVVPLIPSFGQSLSRPPFFPPSLLARRLCQSRREIRRAEGTVMRRRHSPTSSHGCFSWRNSATALFCHFPELLACLYENGPPVMLMGISESLSESARKTSDWPVLYSTPDTGLLSTRTRSSVGSNATVLL